MREGNLRLNNDYSIFGSVRKLEDTKEVIRSSRKSKMDRQWNDRKKKGQQVQKGSTKHYTEILTLRSSGSSFTSGTRRVAVLRHEHR